MTYEELVKDVSKQTGLSPRLVRDVLIGFAISLARIKIGEYLKTPLGAFSWHYIKKRPVRMSNGDVVEVKERVQMRLRPNDNMKVFATDPEWKSIQPADQDK